MSITKPLLGAIGGMGTQASGRFYEMLHGMQSVTSEQEYLDVLLYSMPSIPDRTAYITGQSSDDPLRPLLHAARTLETAGASLLAMPCVTAHYFYDDLANAVDIPFLNMPEETARFIAERDIEKVGLLATDGTLSSKIFHTAFEKRGIDVLVPSNEVQSNLMAIIYDVKRGVIVLPETLYPTVAEPLKAGAEAVILGCTELCIIAKKNPDVVNTLEVLAEASLRDCRVQ